jgi:hypothetical protein
LQHLRKIGIYIAISSFTATILFLIYRPTLFEFFIGDDFFLITWLQKAIHNPQMILSTYGGPWLECPARTSFADAALFYRPFFSTMAFLEYLLWGSNSLFFRLMNLLIEFLCGVMVSLVIALLAKTINGKVSLSEQQILLWSYCSGFLFIIYPLHSEPVNWLSARMDLLVTLFTLLSLWLYIKWRNTAVFHFYALSLISTVLAFLTKEMAVALPLTIFTYELFFHSTDEKNGCSKINYLIKKFRLAIIKTRSYWVILVLYFCLRKIVLGDFVAGYPGSIDTMFNINGWLKGFRDIFIPLNSFLIGTHSFIFKAWHLALIIAVLFTIMSTKRHKANRPVIYFLIIWFFLALIPVSKIFPSVMSCASESRLAYLATAPLCAILAYGLTTYSISKKFSKLLLIPLCLFIGLAARILYTNNLAWAEAGHLTNSIVREFRKYYNQAKNVYPVYVVGLPNITNKCINVNIGSLSGMTRRPFMQNDIYNCTRLDSNDQYTSFGFLKNAISNEQKIDLLYWDSQTLTLRAAKPSLSQTITRKWKDNSLKKILTVPFIPGISHPKATWLKDGTLEVLSDKYDGPYTIVEINLKDLPCWNVDFLVLKLQLVSYKNFGQFNGAQLFFTNDIAKLYSKEYFDLDLCHADLKPTNLEQDVIFSLRNLPAWNLGGKCRSIRIVLPAECRIKLKEISIPIVESVMPRVFLEHSVSNLPGEIRLDHLCNTQNIKYDARSINNSAQVILEIAQPLRFISNLNSTKNDEQVFLKQTILRNVGEFRLNRSNFLHEKTVYRARLRALDKTGKQAGLPSDYFFINLN